jgi:hypothetical protein
MYFVNCISVCVIFKICEGFNLYEKLEIHTFNPVKE